MLITVALVAVIATVPLLGGRLGAMAALRFRAPWLAAAALALQVLILEVLPAGDGLAPRAAHLVSYGLLAGFVALNLRRVPYLWLIGLGGAANAIAIAANDGVMPARAGALEGAGLAQPAGEFVNSGLVEGARLAWLGDVFAVPADWPVSGVFSLGDVLLVLGVALCLHRVCREGSLAAVPA